MYFGLKVFLWFKERFLKTILVPVYVMVGYAGVIAIVYLAFFRTKYKRLIAEQYDSIEEDRSHFPSSVAEVNQDYTPGSKREASASIIDNETPVDNQVTQIAKF